MYDNRNFKLLYNMKYAPKTADEMCSAAYNLVLNYALEHTISRAAVDEYNKKILDKLKKRTIDDVVLAFWLSDEILSGTPYTFKAVMEWHIFRDNPDYMPDVVAFSIGLFNASVVNRSDANRLKLPPCVVYSCLLPREDMEFFASHTGKKIRIPHTLTGFVKAEFIPIAGDFLSVRFRIKLNPNCQLRYFRTQDNNPKYQFSPYAAFTVIGFDMEKEKGFYTIHLAAASNSCFDKSVNLELSPWIGVLVHNNISRR